jgi:hypothetical protein
VQAAAAAGRVDRHLQTLDTAREAETPGFSLLFSRAQNDLCRFYEHLVAGFMAFSLEWLLHVFSRRRESVNGAG